ncbi:hypothetical protein NDU88_003991 [Pleurodeles waltl]|uniref:Uncharacterized protein n=1 Tax=Pleurodeles waltl TaxID=8319 RepID=A0AAV7VEW6_PLEWA|nr:hypothetical protein NDU88_003991 [Pleurodeles waltl]
MARNSGDNMDGAKASRLGKDKGDPAGVNTRPLSTMARQTGRNTTGLGKDAKTDYNITPQLEKISTEIKEPRLTTAQCDDGPSVGLDNCLGVRRKGRGSPSSKEGPQAQQPGNSTRVEDASNISATLGAKTGQNTLLKPGGRDKEKETKTLDWAKDSVDKFYSLTEESDLSSGEHGLSESGSSISSEMGNISSSNEPTVRQARRQHKCTKIRSGSQEVTEFSTSSGSKTLKWDYSGIRLTDATDINPTSGQQLADNNMEGSTGDVISGARLVGTDSGMLQSIYNSIKELQTETRIENRHARVATKRLQGTVRKVAKSCTEIEAKLCSMDERMVAVEGDVDILKQQNATEEGQLTDIMWKLEDYENRQRRNNLCFLGINEGLEGSNIRAYMIKLLRGAFPELSNWDWDNEIQRDKDLLYCTLDSVAFETQDEDTFLKLNHIT